LQMRCEKSTKEKKYGKDSENLGQKWNPATNWIIQKLCNFFLCKWVIHACKALTHPVCNPIPAYDPKSWLRGKEQIKVDHKNIKSIKGKKYEAS
jgi:hypothetical protein